LIASLKKELATQKALAQESRSIQKEIASRDEDLAKTRALADQLSNSLSEAQNENKALQAKLAHSRSASVAVESLGSKTPGSAIKGKVQTQARTIMVGSAEAAQAAQVAQLKEDLYSDLTGLILRGVERKAESDTYDCIQTGRNGSESFGLSYLADAMSDLLDCSTSLQARNRQRGRRKLRKHRVPVYTTARYESRSRPDRTDARISDR